LKHHNLILAEDQYTIREQDPLKQGLKLNFWTMDIMDNAIREQDPLKQGLKLENLLAGKNGNRFASKIH